MGSPTLEFVDFASNVIYTAATEFGGNSKVGSNIGKNIYMYSDLNGGLWNLGTTHAMDTYLDLIAHFEDKNHDYFDTVNVKDVIEERKQAEEAFVELRADINYHYHVVYKKNSKWYKADAKALDYDIMDVYMNWDSIVQLYDADEIALCPDEYTTEILINRTEMQTGGDTFISSWIVAGAEVLPHEAFMVKEDIYDTIVKVVNEYHKYDYLWSTIDYMGNSY